MTFPNTPVLDTFNRANGAIGSNWTQPVRTGDGTATINTNVAIATSGNYGSIMWNPTTFAARQEAFLTIPAACTDFQFAGVYLRLSSPGASYNTYTVSADLSFNYVTRGISGTPTLLSTVAYTALVPGDVFGGSIDNVGADIVITIYKNGAVLRTYTDTGAIASFPAVAGTGSIGATFFGSGTTTRSIDDFGGGNTPPVTYPTDVPIPMLGGAATW
jgi:hypothetical protein